MEPGWQAVSLYNSSFVKLRSQIPEKVQFSWVVFELSFLVYIFNCLIMAFPKPKHVEVVADSLCFLSATLLILKHQTMDRSFEANNLKRIHMV
jgi:hypothetical protein